MGGTASLTIDGASLSLGHAIVGSGAGADASVVVTGSGSTWNLGSYLTVGRNDGEGNLEVNNGGSVSNDSSLLGEHAGSMGSALVTGTDSEWVLAGRLTIGNDGTGSVIVSDGGTVTAGSCRLGQAGGSTGSLTITGAGSTFEVTGIEDSYIGNAGAATLAVESGGRWVGPFWLSVAPTGVVVGDGTIESDLTNVGRVEPGASAGTLTIDGDYTTYGDGTLAIELGGTAASEFDQLAITGTATLDGTLDLSILTGYEPQHGDTFEILTATSITGEFATILGQDIPGGGTLEVQYSPTAVTVQADLPMLICGAIDCVFVVDTTNSMATGLQDFRSNIGPVVDILEVRSGGDLRLGLVTFKDDVTVHHGLTTDITAVEATIAGLTSSGSGAAPASSDEALREVLSDTICTSYGDFNTPFRDNCNRMMVVISDALPGGCDDWFWQGGDGINAHQRALEAADAGVRIHSVHVGTDTDWYQVQYVMQDWSYTTGGQYAYSGDGSDTALAVMTVIDSCPDCNGNGLPDPCDIECGVPGGLCDQPGCGAMTDCNSNSIPDTCERDCNGNSFADDCDIATGTSEDCNTNGIPDECDLLQRAGGDCNSNGIPDECDFVSDCNENCTEDASDISAGASTDCDSNGIPDECEADCNTNGVADACDIAAGTSEDCDLDSIPDECGVSVNCPLDERDKLTASDAGNIPEVWHLCRNERAVDPHWNGRLRLRTWRRVPIPRHGGGRCLD